LKKDFFDKAIIQVMENGYQFFFSSAMHQGLITEKFKLNIKLSRFEIEDKNYIMIECIDVTNQEIRVSQLKEYANELRTLNKRLIEQEKEITRLAYHDNLTGLANRTFFYNLAEKIILDAKRNKKNIGFMFIDIDRFKNINDSYGHEVGDKVLIEVSRILEASTRQNDIVARHGGDEFLILLSDCKDINCYQLVASRIEKANKNVKISKDLSIKINLSIGVSFYPIDGDNIDHLISRADKAMYQSKRAGGNQSTHYKLG
jgi:diguanylate cyclase (GGDEF)-like protein